MHVSHHVTSCHVARELSKHSHYHYHPVCSLAIYCRVCFRFQCHQLSCLCQCTVSLSFICLFKVTILPRMSCLFTVNTLSSEFCFLLNVTTLSRMFCVMLVMLVNCRHNYNHLCLVFHCQHFRFALSCLFDAIILSLLSCLLDHVIVLTKCHAYPVVPLFRAIVLL